MAHDYTKPGMSEATRREIERLTSEKEFRKRVVTANQKLCRRDEANYYHKSHPVRATTRAALRYYAGDTSHFRFTFNEYADLERVNAAITELSMLGVAPAHIDDTSLFVKEDQ